MTLKKVSAFTMMAILIAIIGVAMIGLGVQVEAKTPCPEAWKRAMRAPQSDRCGALYQAALAAEATRKYADDNRQACNVSVSLLNQVERSDREAVQARDNVCAGRPLRPYPPDIIKR